MNRRRFLKSSAQLGSGLCLSDVFKLYFGIQATVMRQAFASSAGANVKNYVNFHMDGAPARWLFDQWLTPNPTDVTLGPSNSASWNPGIATAFSSNQPEYRLYNYRGVRVPAYYQYSVSSSSGSRPMSDLLDHMAVIRGYNSLTDGHEINTPLQMFPDPSAPSLNGLVADQRSDLLASVTGNFFRAPFRSAKGLAVSFISDHTYASGGSINGLMSRFKSSTTTKPGLLGLDQIKEVVDQLHEVVQAQASASNARSAAVKDQLKNARALALLAAEDLVSQWAVLYGKYFNLAQSSIRGTLTVPGFAENAITLVTGDSLDYRSMGNIPTSFDLRQVLSTANPSVSMIRSFALAEYCLKKQITGSLALGWNDTIQNFSLPVSATPIVTSYCDDQHNIPLRLATVMNAGYYRGLASCMLEFVDALKGAIVNGRSLFDDTVVHLSADFGRSPRTDNSSTGRYVGSDHGFDGQVATIISGAVDGPMMMGNISSGGRTNYSGIWGMFAPVDFNGSSEILSPRHVAAAISHLVGGINPWTFTNLVWQLNGTGRLQPKVGAKIV